MPSSPRASASWPLSFVAAGVLVAASAESHAAGNLGGSIALTTDYLLRGVSQSNGSPALQADLHYQTASGWLAGLWASNVEVNPEDGRTVEFNALFGYSRPIARDWSMKLVAVHYAYPGNAPAGLYDYDEFIAGASYRDLLFMTVAVSPNTPQEIAPATARDRTALSYDLALRQPLQGTWSAFGGLGYYDLKGPDGAGYAYWSAGVGYDSEPWHLEVAWFGTAPAAEALYDADMPRSHWAATLIWRF
jgi:uncharacterized protein (TIGR02001 family)